MNVLIVYAHPDPQSFNGVLKDTAVETLTELGHVVQVSDLYGMRFKAVADRDDFLEIAREDYFNLLFEQKMASKNGTFTPDILAEQEKVTWADFILFQYPMWWTDAPAILKGWFDRVWALGFAYPGFYEDGPFQDKKAMLSVTGSTPLEEYGRGKLKGDLNERLFNIQHEKLFFSGIQVLEPFYAGGINKDNLPDFIDQYKSRLRNLETLAAIPFPPAASYV